MDMYKNRQFKCVLLILLMVMGILSYMLFIMKNKNNVINNQASAVYFEDKCLVEEQKYGYSDILEVLKKNTDFTVKSINMMEKEKCNVQIDYNGDINLLYNSLYYLYNSKNFIGINSISINKDAKIINISIDFKKNK